MNFTSRNNAPAPPQRREAPRHRDGGKFLLRCPYERRGGEGKINKKLLKINIYKEPIISAGHDSAAPGSRRAVLRHVGSWKLIGRPKAPEAPHSGRPRHWRCIAAKAESPVRTDSAARRAGPRGSRLRSGRSSAPAARSSARTGRPHSSGTAGRPGSQPAEPSGVKGYAAVPTTPRPAPDMHDAGVVGRPHRDEPQ